MSDEPRKSAPPAWKKPSVASARARRRLQAARARRNKAEAEGRIKITSQQAQLLAEVCTNGGAIAAAARRIGVSPETAYRWMRRPVLRTLYEEFVASVGHQVHDWGTLIGRAQATLLDLLDCEDDRVRKDVAIYLTDRAIGKVANKLDATVTHQNELSEVEVQAALSLVAVHGMTLLEAKRYVREHPEEVMDWAKEQARLPPGVSSAPALGKSEQRDAKEASEEEEDGTEGSVPQTLPHSVSD